MVQDRLKPESVGLNLQNINYDITSLAVIGLCTLWLNSQLLNFYQA